MISDPAKAKFQSWRGQCKGEPEKQPVRYSAQFEPSELVCLHPASELGETF